MKKLVLLFVPFMIGHPASGLNPVPTDTAHWYMQHSYDVLSYQLTIDLYSNYSAPYPKNYSAKITITFQVDSALNSIALNALNSSLEIDSVRLSGTSFTHLNDTLTVQLDRMYNPGEVTQVKLCYRHKDIADQGFYASNGYVFTDFPPEGARKVFPCWDRPSDKATWDLVAKVPLTVRLGSTGLLADSTIIADTIWYHWATGFPVATYLMTFTSNTSWYIYHYYWTLWYNPSDSIPIWLYHKAGETMANAITKIPLITNFYADKFGEYPFEKIGFATVGGGFPWGGMENQTMVNLQLGGYSNESLIAHEHSHQWFGDMITCGTWADIWLNEGFATQCAQLWLENTNGYNTYKNKMNSLASYYLSHNPGWPLYNPDWLFHTPSGDTLYDVATTYNKGACVLFQLRYVVGDSLFFSILKAYASDTNLMYKNAVTEDFVNVVNQTTGEDYTWFFDQWVYAPDHPIYENVWEIDDLGSSQFNVTLTMNQIQTTSVFFKMPVEVGVTFFDGTDTLVSGWNDTNPQTLEWIFDKYPVMVQFDPNRNILLKQATTIVSTEENGIWGIELRQNEPNPFHDQTSISYSIDKPYRVKISILDQFGHTIATPIERMHLPGDYQFILSGEYFTPGTYVCQMECEDLVRTIKLVVL